MVAVVVVLGLAVSFNLVVMVGLVLKIGRLRVARKLALRLLMMVKLVCAEGV